MHSFAASTKDKHVQVGCENSLTNADFATSPKLCFVKKQCFNPYRIWELFAILTWSSKVEIVGIIIVSFLSVRKCVCNLPLNTVDKYIYYDNNFKAIILKKKR